MPIYEYRCDSCGAAFTLRQPMSRSSAPATCPRGHDGAQRSISLFAAPTRSGDVALEAPPGGGCACSAGGSCACSQ